MTNYKLDRVFTLPRQERQLKWEEYRDAASSLQAWLRNATAIMMDRNFPATLMEMKVSRSTVTILNVCLNDMYEM